MVGRREKSIIAASAVILLRKLEKRRKRRWYVRNLNIVRSNMTTFTSIGLILQMRQEDPEKHFSFFRMDRNNFDKILNLVEPLISHAKTHLLPVPAFVRLCITLRLLASGDSVYSPLHSISE